MKHLQLYALFLVFTVMTFYPLTNTDWRVINTLLIGSSATGALLAQIGQVQ
jgi:hypothetical protein